MSHVCPTLWKTLIDCLCLGFYLTTLILAIFIFVLIEIDITFVWLPFMFF